MLHLRNFLRSVNWTGEVPGLGRVPAQAAGLAMGRAARTLIENIADLLPSRGWEAGVRDLEKSKLAGSKYEPSTVRAGLRTLKRAGLVDTRRTRDARTGLEGFSTVLLTPALIGLARQWQALRLELKTAPQDRKKTIKTELLEMQNVNLPFLYEHPGNPHEQGLAADPLLNLSTHRCSKLATPNTGIHTPQGGDASVRAAALALPALPEAPAGKAGGVPGDTPPPPPRCKAGGCESLSKSGPEKEKEEARGSAVVGEILKMEGEGARGSVVVSKNFEITRARRSACWRGREERHQAEGKELAQPWRPDGRPHLQEWTPELQDAPGSKILVQGDQSIFFEIRAFAATLDAFHRYEPGHTTLSMVRPGQQGRMPIFTKSNWNAGGTDGLWRMIDWQKVFDLAFAKSKICFEHEQIGEQVFASPSEKSRMILVDDLKISTPIFAKKLCIILETSSGNYQHLYCADRIITPAERHHIQAQIVDQFGGDRGATGGAQPHRIPGSVNYKPSRNLFVCRLVGSVGTIDGGKALKVDEYLRTMPAEIQATVVQKNKQRDCKKVDKEGAQTGGADTSASGNDWHRSITKASALRASGLCASDVHGEVEKMLLESAQLRGKNDAVYYASRTLAKLFEAGHI